MEHEQERGTGTTESSNRADPHVRKVIPYKEYAVCKAAEEKASTASKPTLEEEENWDEELPLPPHETPPRAKLMVPTQENKWKLMVNQDPVGGINETVSAGNLSDVEWKEDDPLFEFDDENVTKPQTPDVASTPVQTQTESQTGTILESPLRKKPCFRESITVHLSKVASPSCLELDYSDGELLGFTWPALVNIIPWIKYEAQNMVEPTFRQEL